MNDLHCHTSASDGLLSPSEIIERANQNGVTQLAITDHDTIAGYCSLIETGTPQRLTLISGVEISTQWRGMGIHVVGLNFDIHHSAITELLAAQAQVRKQRTKIILEKLTNCGMPLELSDLNAEDTNIGRPHIAQAMVEKGYVKNTQSAFKKYLGAGKIGDVKNGWCLLENAVENITKSGGVAVLAHPNHYKMTRTKLLDLMEDFKNAGGQAIEVISGKQHKNITEKLTQIALDKGFYASKGSDFHRPLSYGVDIGELAPLPDSVTPVWELFGSHRN